MKSLPDSVKQAFGTMGFCKPEKPEDDSDDEGEKPVHVVDNEFVPCLVMNPYDVPPRPVRDIYWHNLYMDKKKKKKLDELEYLVYHYGHDDPDDCYSFIAREDFKSYDAGMKEGFGNLPSAIQAKVDTGAELTEEEQQRVRALDEMNEDAKKDPVDRKRGNYPFKERHEKVKAPPAKRQKK